MNHKYIIDDIENKIFVQMLREQLFQFGHQFPALDGSSYYLGSDGIPMVDRNRETWITCRMAHVYSMGFLLGHSGSEMLVDDALRALMTVLHDDENGGWYPGIKPDGTPLPDKQCYAHAFVILAATSGILADNEDAYKLLEEALAVYDQYFWDDENGLAYDTWNTEFTELSDYRGINANMHTVEAFLAVADVTGDMKYRERAGRIIDHVIGWAKNNNYRIPEHFTKNWEPDLQFNQDKPDDPFKPYGATPGHGIEWARLICQWATITYEDDRKVPYIEVAEQLYKRAIADAWNADGAPGIVYTTDWDGKPVVHDRMHWTLAEAINTSSVLYRITGDKQYSNDYSMFMEYLDEYVLDHDYGSWFHQLDEHNELLETVWPGKSDIYHALQATLIPYRDYRISIAKVAKKNRFM